MERGPSHDQRQFPWDRQTETSISPSVGLVPYSITFEITGHRNSWGNPDLSSPPGRWPTICTLHPWRTCPSARNEGPLHIRPPRRWWAVGPRYTMAFHSCTQHSKSPTLALIDDNIQITVYDESLTGIIGFPDCLIMTSYHMIGTGLLYEWSHPPCRLTGAL